MKTNVFRDTNTSEAAMLTISEHEMTICTPGRLRTQQLLADFIAIEGQKNSNALYGFPNNQYDVKDVLMPLLLADQ